MLLPGVALLGLVTFGAGQVPRSPCPHVFEYVAVGRQHEGLVKIPPPSPGSTLTVMVVLTVADLVTEKYSGSIGVVTDDRVAEKHPWTVNYRVGFPTQNPLPMVSKVIANGRMLCFGQQVTPKPEFLTTSTLKFTQTNYRPRPPKTTTLRPTRPTTPGFNRPTTPGFNRPTTPGPTSPTTLDRCYSGHNPTTPKRPPIPNKAPPKSCGEAESELVIPLIHNGDPTRPGDWPWLAAIFLAKDNTFFCGGSLVDMTHIVTAAHCIQDLSGKMKRPEELYVVVGKFLLQTSSDRDQKRHVSKLRVYEGFNFTSYHNDIAIVELDAPLTYTRWVRPICLWKIDVPEEKLVSREGIVVGWGQDETGDVSERPKMAIAPIVSLKECRLEKKFELTANEMTLCAGRRNGTGPCVGDSGGGLVLSNHENGIVRYYLQGIVSLAIRKIKTRVECDHSYYTVYTNVNKFHDWLRQFIVEAEFHTQ